MPIDDQIPEYPGQQVAPVAIQAPMAAPAPQPERNLLDELQNAAKQQENGIDLGNMIVPLVLNEIAPGLGQSYQAEQQRASKVAKANKVLGYIQPIAKNLPVADQNQLARYLAAEDTDGANRFLSERFKDQDVKKVWTPIIHGEIADPELAHQISQLPSSQIPGALAHINTMRQQGVTEQRLREDMQIRRQGQAITLQGQRLTLQARQDSLKEKQEKKASEAEIRKDLAPLADSLGGNEQIKFKTLIKEGKFSQATDLLTKSEKVDPASLGGLLKAYKAGEVDIKDPKAVGEYFKSRTIPSKADALMKLYEAKVNVKTGTSWFGLIDVITTDTTKLENMGKVRIQLPDGAFAHVPAQNLDAALKAGAKRAE